MFTADSGLTVVSGSGCRAAALRRCVPDRKSSRGGERYESEKSTRNQSLSLP